MAVPITCPISLTHIRQKTGTVLWKLLKSMELLQMWTSFYGKEILPILHTRHLCFWNLCHNCGFVCFFSAFLLAIAPSWPFFFFLLEAFCIIERYFTEACLLFFLFYFSEEQLYFPRVNLDTEAKVIPEIYFLFVCLRIFTSLIKDRFLSKRIILLMLSWNVKCIIY